MWPMKLVTPEVEVVGPNMVSLLPLRPVVPWLSEMEGLRPWTSLIVQGTA